MEPIPSLETIILLGLAVAGLIILPVLLAIFVVRMVRRSEAPRPSQAQQVQAEAMEVSKANDQIIGAQSEKPSGGENPKS